ncbi:unnamed protein product [Nyctereutes procyonoides]|uniref:Axonemal dynein light intermediate polypeptide 1 n=1 Tax=Nyctereutes procyonoides TaxID=34880 RepID=A0A811YCL3_NYCPR|nr:unnamed protein product [Nyctereutes procyonoides]
MIPLADSLLKYETSSSHSHQRPSSLQLSCVPDPTKQAEEILNAILPIKEGQQQQARETSIFPVRRELYSWCFDKLIQEFLLSVQDENHMTITTYEASYDSRVAFGSRKVLKIEELEIGKKRLERQMKKQKAKCEGTKNNLEKVILPF